MNIKPNKKLGQNFLTNQGIIQKMIKAAKTSNKDTILEIGSGTGNITIELAKKAKKVIAIEKDKNLIKILKNNIKNYKNIKIIHADILKIKLNKLKNYKIIANIPFYITSPLIRKFLEAKNPPKTMVLLIQKQVAKKICASPPKMSILSVAAQFYSKPARNASRSDAGGPKIISYVSKNSFWPSPKHDSAIIEIIPNKKVRPFYKKRSDLFFQLVKAGFSSKRKQLANNLSKKLNINKNIIIKLFKKNKLNPKIRAEELSVNDWKKINTDLNQYLNQYLKSSRLG